MENKIIEYWIKNKGLSYNWIAKLFEYPLVKVVNIIENYERNPYIIRESKINHLELEEL